MQALAPHVTVAALADPNPECLSRAQQRAPEALAVATLDELLQADLDAVVIATPSAQHAEQCIRSFERGLAVFCQKPLARNADETRRVLEAARRADRSLGVDFSYRYTRAMQAVKEQNLGKVFALDLVFHNAYGPDKPWFYDKALSGGGCLMDLGVHLVDLALWLAPGTPGRVTGSARTTGEVETYATGSFELDGVLVRLACSWNLRAGQDAVIEATVYGEEAGARFSNVDGSFYDFRADRLEQRHRTPLFEGPDDWQGRALLDWAARPLTYDPACEAVYTGARILDGLLESFSTRD